MKLSNNFYIPAPNKQIQTNIVIEGLGSKKPCTKLSTQDTFEKNNKKKITLQQKTLIALCGTIAITAGVITAIKLGKLSKIKKDIIKCYDEIFDYFQRENPDPNFIKPKLIFQKNSGDKAGAYSLFDNTITIDLRNLNPSSLYKSASKKKISYQKICGQDIRTYLFESSKKGSDRVQATYDEFIFNQAEILAHELTHAKQYQRMLSAEGLKEKFLARLRESLSDFTNEGNFEERLKKLTTFIHEYKPKQPIAADKMFYEEGKISKAKIEYDANFSLETFFKNFASSEDIEAYYLDPSEICATIGEENFLVAVKQGKILRHLQIDDHTIDMSTSVMAENNRIFAKLRKS